MGNKPCVDNLLNQYVDSIPVLPQGVATGQQVCNYYAIKNQFTPISLFTNPAFSNKIISLNPSKNDN